jgi:hypothetical protein
VVAFAGQGFVSEMIKLTTRCNFSHVGMLVVKDNNEILCYESTSKPYTPDIYFDEWYKGVHCFNFLQRVLTYPGRVSVFSLKDKVQDEEKLEEWLDKNHKNHTAFNVLGMTSLGLKKLGINVFEQNEEEDYMFCSQMVTLALKVFLVTRQQTYLLDCWYTS